MDWQNKCEHLESDRCYIRTAGSDNWWCSRCGALNGTSPSHPLEAYLPSRTGLAVVSAPDLRTYQPFLPHPKQPWKPGAYLFNKAPDDPVNEWAKVEVVVDKEKRLLFNPPWCSDDPSILGGVTAYPPRCWRNTDRTEVL